VNRPLYCTDVNNLIKLVIKPLVRLAAAANVSLTSLFEQTLHKLIGT